MSAHDKAMDKASKHTHKMGDDGKCKICNMVMKGEGKIDDKGKKPFEQYNFQSNQGAKNNDSMND